MKRLIVIPLLAAVLSSLYPLQSEEDLFREAENRFLSEDFILAVSMYNEFLGQFPLSEYVPDVQFRKAVALYRIGKTEDAFGLFTRIEQRYRSTRYFPLVHFWKGVIRFEDGRYDEAVQLFEAFLKTGTRTLLPETLLYLAISADKTDRSEEAKDYISRLLTIREPEQEQYAFTLLCSLLIKNGEYREVLERVSGTVPDNFEPRFKDRVSLYRAEAYWNTGEVDTSVELYNTLLDSSPEISSVAYQRLFSHIRKSGDDEELQKILDRAERSLAGELEVLTGFWLRIGIESFKDEKYDLARVYLQRIWNSLERRNIDPLVPLYLSQLYTMEGNITRGVRILEDFRSDAASGDEYILFQLSGLYLQLERWQETVSICRDFLDLFPESERSGEAAYRLAFSLYNLGSLEEALETTQRAFASGAARDERSRLLKLSATVLRKLGRDEDALQRLEEYNALNPSDAEAVIQIAEIAFRQREYDTVIQRAAGLSDDQGKRGILAGYLTGLSLITRKRYDEALSFLQGIERKNAVEAGLEDVLPYVLFYRGWSLYRLAEYDAALGEFRDLTERYPAFSLSLEAFYLAGWCAFSLERFDEALVFFGRYASDAPAEKRNRGRYMYAKSASARGDDRESIVVLEQIYTENPASPFADDALFEHAGILEKNGSLSEASAMYGELYRRYPGSPSGEESLFRRAEILYRQGKWHEARAAFYNLRTAYPDGSLLDAALYWGGMASMKAGEPYGAVLLWEKLIREKTESNFRPDALLKTAEVYRDSEDYSRAYSLYSEFLSVYPDDGRAVLADRTAEELMYLLQGQEEREADLTVTINRTGGASSPEGREALIELARLYLYRGGSDREKVPGLLSEIIAKKDEDPERAARAQYYVGEYYFRKNDLARAWKEFLSAATMNPADKDLMAMSLYRAAQVALTAGKPEDARKLVERLKEHFPESSWAVEAERLLGEVRR